MSEVLRAEGVAKTFQLGRETIPVLSGVDLAVRAGEMVSILGASGAGKSTLLHILGLLDHPTEGTVWCEGEEVSGLSDGRRSHIRNARIGFVFQFYHLLPELTALENVIMPARILRRSGRAVEERARELLDAVGLAERTRHRPAQLSGGERQRVALARALMNEPAVVLCDEPTGNLDVRNKELVHTLLRSLNRSRRQSFVITTHDEGLAARGDRILAIDDGRLAARGGYWPVL